MFKPLYQLFYHKYWVDELYEGIIVKKILMGGLSKPRISSIPKLSTADKHLYDPKSNCKDFFAGLFAFDRKGVTVR